MELRDDYNGFPFDGRTKAIWYILIDYNNKTTKPYKHVSCKNELVNTLKNIIESEQYDNFKLIGFWQGQYSTDGFDIPIKHGYENLKKHFNN